MRVRLIDLEAQHAALLPALREAFERVATTARFVGGPEVEALESELGARLGAPHVVGCGSGTDALMLALLAVGLRPGDEVVVPALSFFATAGAVSLLGGIPIFADVDPRTLGLDPTSAAERAASCSRLRAVLPVHLYGGVTELDPLRAIAADRGAALIEDAAQALGARYADGRAVGSAVSDAACFSFYPTKNLGALGEAGCVATADPERAQRLRRLRNHGSDGAYRHREVGWNARLDALQAAWLRVKLTHFDEWGRLRRPNAGEYDRRFCDLGAGPAGSRPEDHTLPVTLPQRPAAQGLHTFHHYVIRVPAARRDALRDALDSAGVDTAVYYPGGLHRETCFEPLGQATLSLPETERACLEIVALPVHPGLQARDRDRVVDAIAQFFLR